MTTTEEGQINPEVTLSFYCLEKGMAVFGVVPVIYWRSQGWGGG